ncbi:hypothetical protein PG988_006438 [Apiospora saccharicola]
MYGWATAKLKDRGNYSISAVNTPQDRWDRAPLLKRGWVVQERLFSDRILHFFDDMVLWECCSGTLCDISVEQDPIVQQDGRVLLHSSLQWETASIQKQQREGTASHTWEWYKEIVEPYTMTELTFPEDRLPAVSGIAATYDALSAVRYLAGHWDQDLLESLAWSKIPGTKSTRPTFAKGFNPPSWSWASMNTPIKFGASRTWLEISQIASVSVEPASSDPYGAVTRGCLCIRGPILRIDQLWAAFSAFSPYYRMLTDTYTPELHSARAEDSSGNDSDIKTFYILPLFMKDQSANHTIKCLILKNKDTAVRTFVRVGLYRMSDFKRPRDGTEIGSPDDSGYMGREEVYELFRGLVTEEVNIV